MSKHKLFPWDKLDKGQAFFVPALDVQPLREEGLKAAVTHRVLDARSVVCIMQGRLGVLFYRATPELARRLGS